MRLLAVKVDTEKQLDLHTTISLFRPAGTLPRATEIIFRNKRDDTWLEHSLGWLFQRDIDSMAAYPDLSHLNSATFERRPFPVYDAMQALIHAKKAAPSRVHDELIAVEACLHRILQLSNDVPLIGLDQTITHGHYIQRLVDPQACRSPDQEWLPDDILFRFISLQRRRHLLVRPVALKTYGAEVCVRLTEWMYVRDGPCSIEELPAISGYLVPLRWVAEEFTHFRGTPNEFPGKICSCSCLHQMLIAS